MVIGSPLITCTSQASTMRDVSHPNCRIERVKDPLTPPPLSYHSVYGSHATEDLVMRGNSRTMAQRRIHTRTRNASLYDRMEIHYLYLSFCGHLHESPSGNMQINRRQYRTTLRYVLIESNVICVDVWRMVEKCSEGSSAISFLQNFCQSFCLLF